MTYELNLNQRIYAPLTNQANIAATDSPLPSSTIFFKNKAKGGICWVLYPNHAGLM